MRTATACPPCARFGPKSSGRPTGASWSRRARRLTSLREPPPEKARLTAPADSAFQGDLYPPPHPAAELGGRRRPRRSAHVGRIRVERRSCRQRGRAHRGLDEPAHVHQRHAVLAVDLDTAQPAALLPGDDRRLADPEQDGGLGDRVAPVRRRTCAPRTAGPRSPGFPARAPTRGT